MKRCKMIVAAVSIILSLLANPSICHAKASEAEVRVVVLPPRAGGHEHTSVKSFMKTDSHAEFMSAFQRIGDAGLNGDWYLAKRIPLGEYEVRVSIGAGKPDSVRVVRIENRSETLYFGSDVTTAHIVVVDPLGDILKNVVIDKVLDAFGTDFATTFAGTASAIIPSGTYQVQAHAAGYGVATGKVCLCQPESWALLGASIPGGDAVYPDATVRLRGILQSSDSINEPTIIRLAPAYMSSSMAVVLLPGSNGKFALSGALPDAGDYVLVVSQAGHILGTGVLRLPLSNAVSLKLDTGATISLETDGAGNPDPLQLR